MYQESLAVAKRVRIGIVGGGVAGSTIAMYLSQRDDVEVILLEKGPSLVNGPPICHLHAGGNLYREIDEQQCLQLLQESIETLQLYPHCANVRPTVIAVPKRDAGSVDQLKPRLERLRQYYQRMVAQNPANKVLGEPEDYFRLYSEQQMQELAQQSQPETPQCLDDWMIPLAKQLDFSTVKWPLLLVQEYGLSLFRLAATAELSLSQRSNCQLLLNTEVETIRPCANGYRINHHGDGEHSIYVDYLVNACGYRSGAMDDKLAVADKRLVEFKAAYLANWPQQGFWPEVIFHGERGTPNGMAQLTPYADGLFQLHGMTDEITLFKDGLAASDNDSAQPQLPLALRRKLTNGWPQEIVEQRSQKAIDHLAVFLPEFSAALPAAKPLFGAQQIPGSDVSLRAAAVEFPKENYARAEIVKATSALPAAKAIEQRLFDQVDANLGQALGQLDGNWIEQRAEEIAIQRNYPAALARRT